MLPGRLLLLALCSAFLVAVLAAARWADAFTLITLLRPLVLEPPGLAEAARALPERRLTPQEQEVLVRDGVLLVRSFIRDTQLLKDIQPALQQHQQYYEAVYVWSFLYNGAIRTLLREGPIGALAADAMQAEGARVWGAPVWGREGEFDDRYEGKAWHQDAPDTPDVMTIFIAVTDAPHALDFLRGSHHFQAQILRDCNVSIINKKCVGNIDDVARCVKKFSKKHLEPLVGSPFMFQPDLRPGDAVLFTGGMLHRGWGWPRDRLALAVRTMPGRPDACSGGSRACCTDDVVGHDLAVYPKTPLNLRCVRERVLPRPRWLWPRLDDRVPVGTPGPLLRLLAAVSHAAFGHSGSLRSGVEWLSRFLPIL